MLGKTIAIGLSIAGLCFCDLVVLSGALCGRLVMGGDERGYAGSDLSKISALISSARCR